MSTLSSFHRRILVSVSGFILIICVTVYSRCVTVYSRCVTVYSRCVTVYSRCVTVYSRCRDK